MIESFRDELPLLMIRTGKGDGTLAHCSQSRRLVNQKKEVAEVRRRPLGDGEEGRDFRPVPNIVPLGGVEEGTEGGLFTTEPQRTQSLRKDLTVKNVKIFLGALAERLEQ
jgi:hypothetical protein